MFKWLVIHHCPYLLDDSDSSGIGDLGVLEDIDDDKTDDKDTEDKEDKEDKEEDVDDDVEDDDKTDDEDDEEDEDKSDEEDEDEEVEEDQDRITHVADLKKAYPDIFKKFPDVRAALFRDQQYSELFATPKEAQDTVTKAGILDKLEKDLIVDGDPTELLKTIKTQSAESFVKVAYSILPFLQENDKETYLELAALPIKQLIRSMVNKFDPKSNEYKAALYVHNYFFDNTNVNDKVKAEEKIAPTKKSAKEEEYEKRIKEIDQRDTDAFFGATNNSYVTRLSKEVRSTIESDDRLSDWAKTKLVEQALTDIKAQLDNDPRFKRQMESLWSQAKASKYSNDLKSRIVSTALARAKSLVPKVRAKLLAEALGKKVKKDKVEEPEKKNVHKFERKEASRTESKTKKPLTDMDILQGKG